MTQQINLSEQAFLPTGTSLPLSGTINDTGDLQSIDPTNRVLIASDGTTPQLNWATAATILLNPTGVSANHTILSFGTTDSSQTQIIVDPNLYGRGIMITDPSGNNSNIFAPADLQIFSNTALDGSGSFYPFIDMGNNYGAQTVGIDLAQHESSNGALYLLYNDTGFGTRENTAILQLDATSHGFLLPRMTTVQRDAIASPALGLEVFNTDTAQPEFWNGSSWESSAGTPAGSDTWIQYNNAGAFGASTNFTWNDGTTTLTIGQDASLQGGTGFIQINQLNDTSSGHGIYFATPNSGGNTFLTDAGPGTGPQLYINANNPMPDTSAMLQMDSTKMGLLIPRMTSVQKTAIVSPSTGLMVYDTTLNCHEYWNGSAWQQLTPPGGSSGPSSSLQFNNGGILSGDSNLTWSPGTATGNVNGRWQVGGVLQVNQRLVTATNSFRFSYGTSPVDLFFNADGTVSLPSTQIHSVADPTSAQDVATKNYVDSVTEETRVTTVTTTTTITTAAQIYLADATSGGFTCTLPTAASSTNKVYTVKKIDSTANVVTLQGNGAELIDGSNTQTLVSQYQSYSVVSNGTSWYLI